MAQSTPYQSRTNIMNAPVARDQQGKTIARIICLRDGQDLNNVLCNGGTSDEGQNLDAKAIFRSDTAKSRNHGSRLLAALHMRGAHVMRSGFVSIYKAEYAHSTRN